LLKEPPVSEPWYADGLRFACTKCGNCCTGKPGFVWVNDEEVEALAEFRGEKLDEVLGLYTRRLGPRRSLKEKANGDCVFYDREAGCTVYPVRPRQCRTWPFWDAAAGTPDRWEETARDCPGCNQGDLIPAEEITRRMRIIRI
jgi:uncharacterized protein